MKDIISTRAVSEMKGLRGYLGKKVISRSGEFIGRVSDALISRNTFQGVVVRNIFIDREFFSSDSEAIMLSIDPVTLLIGKQVFDSDGKKLGKVTDLARTGANGFSALFVKKHVYSKALKIPKKEISASKTNIILNKAY